MKRFLEKLLHAEHLTVAEAAAALESIMTGQATDAQIAGLLIALRGNGESVDEILGFAQTMRSHAVHISVDDPDAIDLCGTGGDGKGTFNISTVASFVVAGAGVTVAKHGNRSVSSRSGSADLLGALGVNIQIPPERVEICINRIGIGFLFAPMFHPAMKYAAKSRVDLAVRTIFNLLGPLTNPAGVRRQIIGTFLPDVASKLAIVLQRLHVQKACVVNSLDGMDEISIAVPTRVWMVEADQADVKEIQIEPETLGLERGAHESMAGGSADENAEIARRILEGEKVPGRDVVLANAGAALYVAGKCPTMADGVAMAAEAIAAGRAKAALTQLVDETGRP